MPKVPLPHEMEAASSEAVIVQETPFDTEKAKDLAITALGAGAITLVVTAGTIFVIAGALKLVTWVLGGIAGIMATLAPWVAVLLGICAFSAYSK